MAVGDALDQITQEINAQQAQRRAQLRVPAPPAVPPVQAGAGGAASSVPHQGGGPSFFDRIKALAQNIVAPGSGDTQLASETVKGLGAGILRSPVTAAAGIVDTAGDIGQAVAGPRGDIRSYEGHVSPAGIAFRYAPQDAETFSKFASRIDPLSQAGDQASNELASNVASIAVGYGAGSQLLRFAGVLPKVEAGVSAVANPVLRTIAGIAGRAGGAGLANAVVMDPESERFSNILQQVGVHNQFIDWLAHNDGEGALEGRFKNAIEGAGLTAAGDSLFNAAKYWHARYTGDNAAADAIQAQLASQHDGEAPDYIIHDLPGVPPAAAPEKPGYVAGWEDSEAGSLRPVYEQDPAETATPQAKAESADAGATTPTGETPEQEAAAEPKGSTGGPVPPMDPEAMAKAMGDPEAAGGKAPEITTYAAQRAPNDDPQIVGSIDKGSLDALSQEVEHWKDAASGGESLDIKQPSDTAQRVGEFKLGRFQNPDQVAPLLRALSDHIPPGRTLSDAELASTTQAAARELGEDPATILAAAQNIGGTLDKSAENMALLTVIAKRAAADVDVLGTPDWGSASQETMDDASRRIYNLTAVWSQFQRAKAGLGRGLRVNQLPDADSYLNTVRKAKMGDPTVSPDGSPLTPLPRTREEMQTWMDAWGATKADPQLRSDFLEGALTRSVPSPVGYLRRAFPNFFTAAVLSAVRTHMLGFTGPTLMSIMRNTERLSGGLLAAVGNPFLSAADRQANLIAATKTSFNYLETLGEISDAFHWAGKAMAENSTQLHSGMTFDAASTVGPVSPALAEAAGFNGASSGYKLGNLINAFPRVISRIYAGTDELTQRLAYYGEVRARAILEGAQQGLDGEDLRQFVRSKLETSIDLNPTTTTEGTDGTPVTYANPNYGAATDQDAVAVAQRNSFLGPVGSDGSAVRKTADWLNGMRRDIPEMRYIMPVFNVPANILAEIIKRTPLTFIPGFGAEQTYAALRGDLGPIAQAEAHGRMLTGAAFLAGGLMLTRMGLLTGAGPQGNPTARKAWLDAGFQPYSLRVGESWVRLDKYDVAGGLITIPATIADATLHVKQDDGVGKLIAGGIGALAEWFKDRASMRTASVLFNLGDDPMADTGKQLEKITAQTAAGFIPNALQSIVTQQLDPVLRRKAAWGDYLKAALPGLSQELPPVRNVLGEPVMRPADTMGEAIFPVTIAPAVTYKQDPVVDEVYRLYHTTGYAAGADPKAIGYGFFNPQDVQLENGQSLYDAFMEARQHMTVNGLTLRQSLQTLFNSPEYNAAVDADPGQRVTSRGDESRGYMVEQVFNTYNRQIKAELADASPTANRWLTAAAAKLRDDAYLKDVSTQDLAQNPGYYQSHGIDGAVYSDKLRQGASGALVGALSRR